MGLSEFVSRSCWQLRKGISCSFRREFWGETAFFEHQRRAQDVWGTFFRKNALRGLVVRDELRRVVGSLVSVAYNDSIFQDSTSPAPLMRPFLRDTYASAIGKGAVRLLKGGEAAGLEQACIVSRGLGLVKTLLVDRVGCVDALLLGVLTNTFFNLVCLGAAPRGCVED